MSSKRSKTEFDYAGRAAAVEAARLAVKRAFDDIHDRRNPRDPGREAWAAAVRRFWAAVEVAYPPVFWDDVDRLRADDWSGLESAVRFLEADPYFFRSGYVKARLITLVNRAPLSKSEVDRLRAVVLAAVDGRDREEFRRFCRLAVRVDGEPLRSGLRSRAAAGESGVRRRARWVLDALEHGVRLKSGLGSGNSAADRRSAAQKNVLD